MIQYSRDARVRAEKPRRTGYPAFAGYDAFYRSGTARYAVCKDDVESARAGAHAGFARYPARNIFVALSTTSVMRPAEGADAAWKMNGMNGT
jgi:hypothetical protein